MKADAVVPPPVALPDAEDRFVTGELERRRDYPVVDVLQVLREMAQPDLLETSDIEVIPPNATLSEAEGLESQPELGLTSESVSLTPMSHLRPKV